jgi:hypothetical protein
MKTVLIWAGISSILLLAALFLHSIPDNTKGMALTAVLFLTTGLMLVKVCRGSR